jgi:integrase
VEENGLSAIRLRYYQNQLSFFLDYCNKNNLSSIQNLDLPFLLGYLQQLDTKPKQTAYLSISSIRGFLKYLYEHKFIFHDLSKKLPKFKKVNQPNLPSVYSKEEIEKLILSVDRSSPIGKRNYAIILIAARLGLRASDISNLKFENIFWEKSTIELNQVKTGKKLILPLMPDIGNAIVEYLKFGRPNSDEPYVFLKERPPYTHFETNVVTHLVQRAFKKAGIDTNGKRFGPHSLRHSLGFRMLAENTTIHVISEVFGHESTESTKFYLRVDLNSMRNCMLDVPLVANKFYEQKGFLL